MATQYQAVYGVQQIDTANSNLDGSGTITNIIRGNNYGTIIRSITIQAAQDVTAGMIRLFTFDGSNYSLLKEFPVEPVVRNGQTMAYCRTINLNTFILPSSIYLAASTENSEKFMITILGLDITGFY